jgi:hypothetical protein
LTGILTIQSKTFNAHKYITYKWNQDDPFLITLYLTLPCHITKNTFVYINVNINDCSTSCLTCDCSNSCGCTK